MIFFAEIKWSKLEGTYFYIVIHPGPGKKKFLNKIQKCLIKSGSFFYLNLTLVILHRAIMLTSELIRPLPTATRDHPPITLPILKIGYDRECLIVLMPQHKYSKLKKIHEGETNLEHNGVLADLSKSRERYWIPQEKRILTTIRFNCFKCKLKNKILEKQIMAPLPETRMKPSPVWHTTSLDLFGPLRIVDSVKRRTTGKCWGLIDSCTVTRCVHLDITEDYSTDSMLMTLRRFIAERGYIAELQSDQRSQLKASAEEIAGKMMG